MHSATIPGVHRMHNIFNCLPECRHPGNACPFNKSLCSTWSPYGPRIKFSDLQPNLVFNDANSLI